ncbi:M23 family metallopeptidase [Paenibacillus sp. N3/727]|uniref:M23 family metallopeptidase n=1 Tax=Paenibacillus sp. N3/727 TaxID=2925845 RepID=UPI001F532A2F|nr:M23 family metallopeptidase [Paenibacillus sp. N3/727]UNK19554.1 M23 family metallopeptidase [Paenibacillus sp. N3/727]
MKRLVTLLSVLALCIASLSTVASANSVYTWPVPESTRITQGFSSGHNGIDIGAKTAGVAGNKIVAFYGGTVSRSGWSTSYGWVVYIHHVINNTNYQSRYAHMNQSPSVSLNQNVSKGTTVGYMGQTGDATGVHLHFETRKCASACQIDNSSTPVNPITNFFPEYSIASDLFTTEETDLLPVPDFIQLEEDEVFYSMEDIQNMSVEERIEKGIPIE